VVERFEVFLVKIAAAREEQDRSLRPAFRKGPVDPADRPAIFGMPETLDRIGRNCLPLEPGGLWLTWLANASLLPLVTFW